MNFNSIKIINSDTGQEVSYDAVDVDSIKLSYNGGDEKIRTIISSTLDITLIDKGATDKRYKFLSNRNSNYMIEVWMDDQSWGGPKVFWKGKIVPSEYQEPITSMNAAVSFTAIDGLAILKEYDVETMGLVYLSDFFFKALNTAGITGEYYFFPAIENSDRSITDMQIDTDKWEGQSYYEAIQELMESLLCSIHYQEGKYWIVGQNLYHKNDEWEGFQYTENDGIDDFYYTRNTVSSVFLPDPRVSYSQPVKEIKLLLPGKKKIVKKGLGDVVNKAVSKTAVLFDDNPISPTWYNVGLQLELKNILFITDVKNIENRPGQYKTVMKGDNPINENEFILYNQYIDEGGEIEIYVEIVPRYGYDIDGNFVSTFDDDNLRFKLKLDNQVVAANYTTSENYVPTDIDLIEIVRFTKDLAKIIFKYKAARTGLFQIYLYAYKELIINKFKFNIERGVEEYIAENDGVYNYEKKLPVVPDKRMEGKSIIIPHYQPPTYTRITSENILYVFQKNGLNYIAITRRAASLWERYKYVEWNGAELNVIDVVYNLYGGEQIVMITDDLSVDTSHALDFTEKFYNVIWDLSIYDKWVDWYYGYGKDAYIEVYSSIIKKLMEKEFAILDYTANVLISPLDIISFSYSGQRKFVPGTLDMNLLREETTVYAHELAYEVDSITPIPYTIFVESPIIIEELDDSFVLSAYVYPNGGNNFVQWTMVSGTNGTITSPTSKYTTVTGVTDDYYRFRISVDDGYLLPAEAYIDVIRKRTKTFSMLQLSYTSPSSCRYLWEYKLELSQELRDEDVWILQFHTKLDGLGSISVFKNGINLSALSFSATFGQPRFKLSYTKYDEIIFKFNHYDYDAEYANCHNWQAIFTVDIESVEIVSGLDYAIALPFNFELKNPPD